MNRVEVVVRIDGWDFTTTCVDVDTEAIAEKIAMEMSAAAMRASYEVLETLNKDLRPHLI